MTSIKVTIFDHSEEEHCDLCGVDRSLQEISFVTEHLKRKYGEEVEVKYIDLAESPENNDVMEKIRAQNLPLPVVAINGVLKLAGSVEYRAIMEAIETQKEVGIWKGSMM